MTSVTNDLVESNDDYIPPVKLKKANNEEDHNDLYCFECHDEGDVICCDSCPRVYHCKCLGLSMLPEGDWTCPECTLIQSSNSMAASSTLFKRHSIEEFHTMLKFTLRRMKSHPHASPFMQPVDTKIMPEYLDYIIYPMDLETIEKNIDHKKYASTDAFLADIKWIVHNSVVFNGNQSKFTAIARALLKIARHEMTEIEICSECYLRSAQPPTPDWFAEPCSVPHTLCWAKMKGYQPWPAKILRVINDEADVRFFGQHDRAWVPIGNCFILSKEYPGVEKKKSNANFEKSMSELNLHIERLKALYGQFNYAPIQTALSKTKPFKFVSVIDDTSLPTYMIVGGSSGNNTLRSSVKCVKQARSPLPQTVNEASVSMKPVKKRSNENNSDQEDAEPSKRARVLSKPSDDLAGNSSRIVLRIRKPSDDISSTRSEASTSSNSSHPTIVNIKEPLASLKEDEENDMDYENQSQVPIPDVPISDLNEPKSNLEKVDDESLDVSPENQLVIASPTGSTSATEISFDVPSPKEDQSSTQKRRSVHEADVKSTVEALLDAIDALKSISEVRFYHHSAMSLSNSRATSASTFSSSSHVQYAERRVSTKHPRKPRPQPRPVNTQAKTIPSVIGPPASFNPINNDRSSSPNSNVATSRHSPIGSISAEIPKEIPAVTQGPAQIDRYQPLARSLSIDSSSVKSEPMAMQDMNIIHRQKELPIQRLSTESTSMSTRSFLISPPASTNHPRIRSVPNSNPSPNPQVSMNSINTMAPRIPTTVSQKLNHRPLTLPMATSTRQAPSTTNKRPLPNPIYPATAARNSNPNPSNMRITPPTVPLPTALPSIPQSFEHFAINVPTIPRRPNGTPLSSLTPPLSTRNPVRMAPAHNYPIGRSSADEQPFNNEIQTIVKCFNDKFQQMLTDFTVKIETALESNRQKYEKELDETRRSYRASLNELRTVTSQQVQEMHKSLELQYWTRVAEMRNQYESNLQHQMHRPSKHMNGGPRP